MSQGYQLGKRSPSTLPGAHKDSESESENRMRSAVWRSLRKRVAAGRFLGAKY